MRHGTNGNAGGQLLVPSLEEQQTGPGFASGGFADEDPEWESCPVYSPEEEMEMERLHARPAIAPAPARPTAADLCGRLDDEALIDLICIADDSGADVLCDAAAAELCRRLGRVGTERGAA